MRGRYFCPSCSCWLFDILQQHHQNHTCSSCRHVFTFKLSSPSLPLAPYPVDLLSGCLSGFVHVSPPSFLLSLCVFLSFCMLVCPRPPPAPSLPPPSLSSLSLFNVHLSVCLPPSLAVFSVFFCLRVGFSVLCICLSARPPPCCLAACLVFLLFSLPPSLLRSFPPGREARRLGRGRGRRVGADDDAEPGVQGQVEGQDDSKP